MTRQELLRRLEPILTQISISESNVRTLMHSPEFDEDYKVARSSDLSAQNLDRLYAAAVELSAASEALLGYGQDNRTDSEVADAIARQLLGLDGGPIRKLNR